VRNLARRCARSGPRMRWCCGCGPKTWSPLERVPVRTSRVVDFGRDGGLSEHRCRRAGAPPRAWRIRSTFPGSACVRVDYALSWFRIRKIPLVAQQVQVDTYLACGLVSRPSAHGGRVRAGLSDRARGDGARSPRPDRLLPTPDTRPCGSASLQRAATWCASPSRRDRKVAALGDWITPSGRSRLAVRRGFGVGVRERPLPAPDTHPAAQPRSSVRSTRCPERVSLTS